MQERYQDPSIARELKTSTVLCKLDVGWLVQPGPVMSRGRAQRGTVQRFNHSIFGFAREGVPFFLLA